MSAKHRKTKGAERVRPQNLIRLPPIIASRVASGGSGRTVGREAAPVGQDPHQVLLALPVFVYQQRRQVVIGVAGDAVVGDYPQELGAGEPGGQKVQALPQKRAQRHSTLRKFYSSKRRAHTALNIELGACSLSLVLVKVHYHPYSLAGLGHLLDKLLSPNLDYTAIGPLCLCAFQLLQPVFPASGILQYQLRFRASGQARKQLYFDRLIAMSVLSH